LYLGFIGIIITLVIIAGRNKEELVAKDYYSQELRYQEKIDAINNESALKESIDYEVGEKSIAFNLPGSLKLGNFSGEIFFYCPADSKKDAEFKMSFDHLGKQFISKTTLQKGIYKMKLSWIHEGKNYFKEHIITIN